MPTRSQRERQEAKRRRRMERREHRFQEEQRERLRRRLRRLGLGVLVIAAIAAIAVGVWYLNIDTRPGRSVAASGAADHSGAPPDGYSTNPPTSGPHTTAVPEWGEQAELSDVLQVHGLEHGGVIVQYNCPSACPELVQQLRSITSRYSAKVILAPNSRIDSLIALTSWGKIDLLDQFDRDRISEFVDKNRNHAPESNQP